MLLFIFAWKTADMTISEFNIMYHLEDIAQRQFQYLDPSIFFFESRIKNIVRVLNEIKADVSCVFEWNGNKASQFYIAEKKELIKQLKIAFESGVYEEKLVPVARNFIRTEEFEPLYALVKGVYEPEDADKKIHLKELKDRLTTILEVENIEMMKSPFKSQVVQRNSGTVIKKGESQINDVIVEPVGVKKEDVMPAMLFIYNTLEFKEMGELKVYISRNKEGILNTHNFMVQELKHLKSEKKFVFICAHFNAEDEGFVWRKIMGKEIRSLTRKMRKNDPLLNFVILGNLNAEIEEISFDLGIKIARLSDQRKSTKDYSVKVVVTPKNEIHDLVSRIEWQWKTETQIKLLDALKLDNGKLNSDKPEPGFIFHPDVNVLKNWKNELEHRKLADNIPIWIEANNFPTERKIKVNEIDFEEIDYKNRLKSILLMNPEIQESVSMQKGWKKTESLQTPNVLKAFFMGDEKMRTKNKTVFLTVVDFLRSKISTASIFRKTWIEFNNFWRFVWGKSRYGGFNLSNYFPEDVLQGLLGTLLHDSKMDYILFNFMDDFRVTEVRKVNNFEGLLVTGIPSIDFSSDHFSCLVKISFDEKKPFILNDFVGGDPLTFELKPEERLEWRTFEHDLVGLKII